MSAVFADTFYWIALINPGDRYAQEVQRFDDPLSGGNVYTTEEVLAEVLTFFAADTWLRIRAVETVREILSDPAVHIIPQSHESFLSGNALQILCGCVARNSPALASATVSLRNNPVPDSIPARYLSFSLLRWIGKNST